MAIRDQLGRVQDELAAACRRASRLPEAVRLMAVSKTHPADAIAEAYEAGQRLFGENRVQEVQAKAPALTALHDLEMHLIGPLQNNKTGKAAELFHAIDTLDSAKTAARLQSAAAALGKVLPVLLEVKLSPEETKHGLAPDHLPALIDALVPLNCLRVTGLLTVAPAGADPEAVRPYFRQLRRLRDQFQPRVPTLTELSMGMSGDFAVAVEEGSTTVRLGTAIFGRREPR